MVGRPASAVSISCADSVDFNRCTFEYLASTAVDYFEYVHGGNRPLRIS